MSKYFKANLDIGHFTAGNNDGIAFIEKHHDRITHMHLKDRSNDGPNMPWARGNSAQAGAAVDQREHYPIYCVIEYEYKGTETPSKKPRSAWRTCAPRWLKALG
jgi:hypothetical protein